MAIHPDIHPDLTRETSIAGMLWIVGFELILSFLTISYAVINSNAVMKGEIQKERVLLLQRFIPIIRVFSPQ